MPIITVIYIYKILVPHFRLPFDVIKKHLILRYERDLKIPVLRQPSTKTCWATCYKMVDDWRGKRLSFCHYVRLQTGDCGSCSKPDAECNQPRFPDRILRDWVKLGYAGTRHVNEPLTLPQIRTAIKKKRPVQAYISFRGEGEAHFFLIRGTSRVFSADTSLLIADPGKADMVELEFSRLGQWGDWQQSWTIAP